MLTVLAPSGFDLPDLRHTIWLQAVFQMREPTEMVRVVVYAHLRTCLCSDVYFSRSLLVLAFPCSGAFKFRGAMNSVLSLSDEEAARGVVTHSSGNHAGALACAAKLRGIPAYIIMPTDAPKACSCPLLHPSPLEHFALWLLCRGLRIGQPHFPF